MRHAICNLSLVALRSEPSDAGEMVNQVLFGEHFEILEEKNNWCRVRLAYDNFGGWIDKKQLFRISEEDFNLVNSEEPLLSADLVEFVDGKGELIPVPLGTVLNGLPLLGRTFSGTRISGQRSKAEVAEMAHLYLHAPFLKGGRSPFGIDAGGFVQMVYKLGGYQLQRTAAEQAKQGENLSFIEESEPGDLAFFDDNEGVIRHVGMVMGDNYILHADGKVRLDRMDHSGIYNPELRRHTHQLRVIKKII